MSLFLKRGRLWWLLTTEMSAICQTPLKRHVYMCLFICDFFVILIPYNNLWTYLYVHMTPNSTVPQINKTMISWSSRTSVFSNMYCPCPPEAMGSHYGKTAQNHMGQAPSRNHPVGKLGYFWARPYMIKPFTDEAKNQPTKQKVLASWGPGHCSYNPRSLRGTYSARTQHYCL